VTPKARRLADQRNVAPERIAATSGTAVVRADDVEAFAAERDEGPETDVRASPRARRLAEQHGIDLASVAADQDETVLSVEHVERAVDSTGEDGESGAATSDTTDGEPSLASGADRTLVEEQSLEGVRRSVSDRLSRSDREAVHVTVNREAVVDDFLDRVDELDGAAETTVSFVDLLLVAVSETLADHPEFNATFEDGSHRVYAEHNVCVAVDTDRGLLAPVIPDLQDRDVTGIASARDVVTDRVSTGEHSPTDLEGGTFTVSNLGPFGVSSFDPIINPPQVAILGVNAIERAVVPVEDALQIVQRVTFSLSFDHRVVDGADAARFLETLSDYVEAPETLS
jgi:pyruvate dehydrogenase E2 component (dihydrolipoamide acetyltransferase)